MRRRQFMAAGAAAAASPLLGCTGGLFPSPAAPEPQPAAATVDLPRGGALPTMPRLASSGGPGFFEGELTAAPFETSFRRGTGTFVWAYNRTVPGPVIELNEGDRVRIGFINGLSLQPSNIHWHGLPVPPEADGSPFNPIAPFSRFVYDFEVPYGTAGTYWYHPHPHEVTHEQVFRGMAGLLIVRSPEDPIPAEITEKNLFISDLRIDGQGQITPNTDNDDTDGREGNHLLVNGVEAPSIAIRNGERQRWRIVNATNARFLRLALSGHRLTQIATDGGLMAEPIERDEIFLGPAERVEVIVTGTAPPGSQAALLALPYDRHRLRQPGPSPQVTVASLVYGSGTVPTPEVPSVLRPISALGAPVRQHSLTFNANLLMNNRLFDASRVDIESRGGEVEEWEVLNVGLADHPFHIHGGQFQLLSKTFGGVTTEEPLAWRDTFNLRPGESGRYRMVQSHGGTRVFHCHILEHEDHGMMGRFDVS